jgi:P27 family predicted phage terminase small subunit
MATTRKTPRKPATISGNHAGIAVPPTLPAAMAEEFHELVDHMSERAGVVRTEDVPLIEQLLFHRHVVREAFSDILTNGIVIDGKANPACAMIGLQAGAVTKLAGLLSLGPSARAKLKAPPVSVAAAGPWEGA